MTKSNITSFHNIFTIPIRLSYFRSAKDTLKYLRNILGLISGIGIIDLLFWILPSPSKETAVLVFKWFIVLTGIFIFVVLLGGYIVYQHRSSRYIEQLEKSSSYLRGILLQVANIDNLGSKSVNIYTIAEIKEIQGSVSLLIVLNEYSGLRSGSQLDVVTNISNELWGTVKVDVISDGHAWASPVDRANTEFWEHLEDRMKYDPSPPPGIHLEPMIPKEFRDFMMLASVERD